MLIFLYHQKKGDDKLSPRTGRPTDNPKKHETRIRMSDKDVEKLNYCAIEMGMSKSEIIRKGIDTAYRIENIKKEETILMTNKYNKSFEISRDEIPIICPICGTEFDVNEDIDTSPYKTGFRSVLMCPKCNFQKVLSYITEKDAEEQMRKDMEEDI